MDSNDISKLPQKELLARFKKLQELSNNDKELIDILRVKYSKLEEELNSRRKEAEGAQRNYESLSNMTVYYFVII